MKIFKKSSAIFGISSVVAAAIVGGFFIRNKIISDNLYYKFLAEFEVERKRQIKIVEENISEINKNLNKSNYEKNNLNKKINKYEEEIKILKTEILDHQEKIKELNVHQIKWDKAKKLNTGIDEPKLLKPKILKIKSKLENLKIIKFNKNNAESILKNKSLKRIIKLTQELSKLKVILENKKKMLSNYADNKKRTHKQLKQHLQEKLNKESNRLEIEKELQSNKNSLMSLEVFIKKLLKDLLDRKEKLIFLQNQKPPQSFY